MYIPVVPFVPNVKVINENIIYSDIVSPIKKGKNSFEMINICDIKESDLETCIKTILESNTNIIFNTIQYSKENKTLYFYTNEKVCTKAWNEKVIHRTYSSINSYNLLEEIKDVFLSKTNTSNNSISVYDLAQLIKFKNLEFKKEEIECQKKCDKIIYSQYGKLTNFIIFDFNDEQKTLNIGFKFGVNHKEYEKTSFSKVNGRLCIVETNCCWNNEILKYLGKELSKFYDKCLKRSIEKEQSNYNINSVNTNFAIHIGTDNVEVYVKYQPMTILKNYKLVSANSMNKYNSELNSKKETEIFDNFEKELLKKIFIEIDDCPEWSKSILYELRQSQLKEQQQCEIKKQYKELQKKLNKKVFPFVKK